MRIVSERAIREFWQDHPESESPMRKWIQVVRAADWAKFPDVRQTFNSVDVYKRCAVFNVGGNKYRIIAMLEYSRHLVFIRAILAHREYDDEKWKPDCE